MRYHYSFIPLFKEIFSTRETRLPFLQFAIKDQLTSTQPSKMLIPEQLKPA